MYASVQDMLDRDSGALWNLALDTETGALNERLITQALDFAGDEINSFLSRRYVLPLDTVPRLLTQIAVTLALYWLSDRDNQVTELTERRYKDALQSLRDIAGGKRDLGLPPVAGLSPEGGIGKVTLVQEGERRLTRKSLRSAL